MDSSLLFPILKSISVEKRPLIYHFLRSSFTNPSANSERQIRLVQAIFECQDIEYSAIPDNQTLFSRVFGNHALDLKKLEKLRSLTLAQVKRFIAEEQRKSAEPEVMEQLRFATYMRINGQYDIFVSEIKKIEKKINQMPESIEKMYCAFMKEYEVGYFKSIENNKKDDSNVLQIVRALDNFYLSHRLHYELSFRQQQQFSNLVKDSVLFDAFPIDVYDQLYQSKPVLIDLYHQLSRFFKAGISDKQEDVAPVIFNFIQKNESILSKHVLRECLTCLINYYTRLINLGKTEYYNTLFMIQKISVERGYIYYLDKIHAADFNAIVTIGLRLNELDWTWAFINTNKSRILNKRQSTEMLRFIHASYYFQKKDYKNTSRYLKETFEELQFKTTARILELKLLFETQHPDLIKKLNAAKVFFYRDVALPHVKKTAANKFIDYIKQMSIPGTLNNQARLNKIMDKLNMEPIVAEKLWLIEKLSSKLKQ